MGLKFKKFKAKLNWKIKEPPPEVVCLRYHINSEFDSENPIIPNVENIEVIKQRKLPPKPSLHNLFDNIPVSTRDTQDTPKGILKKSNDEFQNKDLINTATNVDTSKETNLTLMTQKHEYENTNILRKNKKKHKPIKFLNNVNDNENVNNNTKTVNWRETIEYVPVNENDRNEQQGTNFNTQVTNHYPFITKAKINNLNQVNTFNGNRNGYSNAAASIFFTETDPQPSSKV